MARRLCLFLVLMTVILPSGLPAAADSAPQVYRVDTAGIGSCYDADLSLMLPGHVFAYLQPGMLEVYFPRPPAGLSRRERVLPLGDQIDGLSAAASAYLADAVVGTDVLLAFDSQTRSPSGALLAYIYLQDGTCVNLALIRAGLAPVAAPEVTFQFRDEFEMYERKAQELKKGIWGRSRVERSEPGPGAGGPGPPRPRDRA